MAAAKAVAETGAFGGLVAETAERWLGAEHEEGWAQAAGTAWSAWRQQRAGP
jgi:hypothetical protein